MEYGELIDLNRDSWGEGPWNFEEDQIKFTTEEGYIGFICRNPASGNLCGYVGVPEDHEAYRMRASDIDEKVIVHGGVTFTDFKVHNSKELRTWWVGFDCGHSGDLIPSMEVYFNRLVVPTMSEIIKNSLKPLSYSNGVYRNVDYVRTEIEGLSKQLAEL